MQLKIIMITGLGFLFLGLGTVGLFLPVWPTTPFVLLSAACFSSTPRLKAWLMKISLFKEYIENYENNKGLSKTTVRISLVWLWGMMFLSMALVQTLWISFLLCMIGAAVTGHILWISRSKGEKENREK